jgi:integrase
MIYQRTRNGIQSDDWTIVVTQPGTGGKRITRTFRGTRKDAERRERDLMAAVESNRWAEVDRTRLRAVVTLSQLAEAWLAAGMPKPGGRPRSEAQRERLLPFLKAGLTCWGTRSPGGIGPRDFEAYGSHKRQHARTGTGERAADLELVAMHNLCTWCVSTGRIPVNPFATRPTYRAPEDVRHCTDAMPADDDELHTIAREMFAAGGQSVVAGAHLLMQTMTGLRPGEPGALRWDAVGEQPGARRMIQREGQEVEVMLVRRLKGGINPGVRVHGALADFLAAWRRYTLEHYPDSPWMLPDPTNPLRPLVPHGASSDSHLSRLLQSAAVRLGLPSRKPHGMRAYFVRVRRSQGIDDASIAVELGQGSGPGLIVRTYGQRLAILGGDGLYDWIPANPETVAWRALESSEPANVIRISASA